MTKLIPLTKGQFALVDDADFDWLSQWRWYFQPIRNTGQGYAARSTKNPDGSRLLLYMHRLLLQVEPNEKVDHRNRNSLDNQRMNLRRASTSENLFNTAKRINPNHTSRFKGVCLDKRDKKWRAEITVERKFFSLGYYATEIEAARAYDAAAVEHFGEFAYLNFPQECSS